MSVKIYLAATSHVKTPIVDKLKPHYLLESFMDIKSDTEKTNKYVDWCLKSDGFLLDSGAFAFMNGNMATKNDINIEDYVKKYINFINKKDILSFFEMDLDCVLSYDSVKQIREEIEQGTGKPTIPVWHKSRGIDEWYKLTEKYSYVAIGGIASKEIKRSEWGVFNEMVSIAHKNNCLVHGLGFLPLDYLNNNICPFDTVDGTSWQGHMRGQCYVLDNNILIKYKDDRYWKDIAHDCFKSWTEFSILKG